MNHTLNGDNVEITDALRGFVAEKLAELDVQGTDTSSARVTLKTDGSKQSASGTLQVDGHDLTAITATASDLHTAIDQLVNKLYAQLKRHKQRQYGRPQ
ncbi:ribosome hibernation-promoting factor, HPF/YfiA family [Streptomyces sp. NPDC058279]|uniref:ribosome hibernation-promoting factor, HPF/YfiA family n=1 Tax=Streptomyces sp. NPDC058279 TaxID=3346418 RepID=UPI0036EE6F4E